MNSETQLFYALETSIIYNDHDALRLHCEHANFKNLSQMQISMLKRRIKIESHLEMLDILNSFVRRRKLENLNGE